jgi:hypothetical protein
MPASEAIWRTVVAAKLFLLNSRPAAVKISEAVLAIRPMIGDQWL